MMRKIFLLGGSKGDDQVKITIQKYAAQSLYNITYRMPSLALCNVTLVRRYLAAPSNWRPHETHAEFSHITLHNVSMHNISHLVE